MKHTAKAFALLAQMWVVQGGTDFRKVAVVLRRKPFRQKQGRCENQTAEQQKGEGVGVVIEVATKGESQSC